MLAVPSRPPWQNPRILSTLMLVFVAGGVSGALSMQLGLHEKLHRVVAASSGPPRQAAPAINLERIKTELNLSDDQSQKIALVLEDWRLYYQDVQVQLDDIRATGKSRILEILDANQRSKFNKLINDLAPQVESPNK